MFKLSDLAASSCQKDLHCLLEEQKLSAAGSGRDVHQTARLVVGGPAKYVAAHTSLTCGSIQPKTRSIHYCTPKREKSECSTPIQRNGGSSKCFI